jgi:hypothetical protein
MYALARNTWKFQSRDKRKTKAQPIEYDCLAPDTAEEMFQALDLLEAWTAQSYLRRGGEVPGPDDDLQALGRRLLEGPAEAIAGLEVAGENLENSRRVTLIVKPRDGYHAYRQMLHLYAVKNLLEYLRRAPKATRGTMCDDLAGPRERHWVNLGGQLVRAGDLERLRADLRSGKLDSWTQVHQAYAKLWDEYPHQKQRHALATLLALYRADGLTADLWCEALDRALEIQQSVCDQVFRSRQKDYESPFRRITFRNAAEMHAVLGTAEDNSFVRQVREETETFRGLVQSVKQY